MKSVTGPPIGESHLLRLSSDGRLLPRLLIMTCFPFFCCTPFWMCRSSPDDDEDDDDAGEELPDIIESRPPKGTLRFTTTSKLFPSKDESLYVFGGPF